jgi:hypothetical protein
MGVAGDFTIGRQGFAESGLTSIQIPSSIEVIHKGAFRKCTSLESVIFETECRLKSVGCCVFEGCSCAGRFEVPAATCDESEEEMNVVMPEDFDNLFCDIFE